MKRTDQFMADPRENEDNLTDDNSLGKSDGGRCRLMKPPLRFTSVIAVRSDSFKFPGNLSRIIRIYLYANRTISRRHDRSHVL